MAKLLMWQTQRSDMQITAETAGRSLTSNKFDICIWQMLSLYWLHNTKCPSETQRKVNKLKIKRERQINHEGVVWTCQPRVVWPCFFLRYSLTSRWDYLSSTANFTKQCYNFTKCEKFPQQSPYLRTTALKRLCIPTDIGKCHCAIGTGRRDN